MLAPLSTTSKNCYLVEGPEDEIVFLVNDTGRVHVVRDLHGELVFDDNKAVRVFSTPNRFDRFSLLQIRLEIVSKGAQEVSFAINAMLNGFHRQSDIVVVARWLLSRSSKGDSAGAS